MAEGRSKPVRGQLRLDLLGGFAARDGAGRDIAIGSRKAQALLAFLGLSPGQPQPREKLTALLWSNRGEAQARSSLRQALSELRRALPENDPPFLRTQRDSVWLAPDAVEVDAVTLESLIGDAAPEALAEAAALYRGDFLDGLDVRDAAFEDWQRGERERLRERASWALGCLLDHQAGEQAIATARRLLALDPLNEATHRRLMRLYADSGERALALKQYQACRDVLTAELGVSPQPETEQLAEEIRTGSARSGAVIDPAPDPRTPAAESLPLPDKPSVVVLPFVNMSGNAEQEYFSDGITEDIITGLGRFRELFVIARNSSFTYKGRPVKVRAIGEELGIRYVVEGSVRKAGNRVRITAQLVEAATSSHLWAERYDREIEDIFTVQDEVTASIVSNLAGQIGEVGRKRAVQKSTENLVAYDCFLRGEYHLAQSSMADVLEARKMFEKAIELDPHHAQSWAGLALSYMDEYWSGWTPAPEAAAEYSLELARKAVAVDERDSRAHLALSEAYLYARKDFDRARVEIEKATELNPNDYTTFCFMSWLHALDGRATEGIACAITAFRLNPFAAYDCRIGQFLACFAAGAYDDALRALQNISSTEGIAQACLAACYAKLGRSAEADRTMAAYIAEAKSELTNFPGEEAIAWRQYWLKWFPFRSPSVFDDLMDGMRDAGLPV